MSGGLKDPNEVADGGEAGLDAAAEVVETAHADFAEVTADALDWALEARGLKRGVAAICIGGGEGTAIAIERP